MISSGFGVVGVLVHGEERMPAAKKRISACSPKRTSLRPAPRCRQWRSRRRRSSPGRPSVVLGGLSSTMPTCLPGLEPVCVPGHRQQAGPLRPARLAPAGRTRRLRRPRSAGSIGRRSAAPRASEPVGLMVTGSSSVSSRMMATGVTIFGRLCASRARASCASDVNAPGPTPNIIRPAGQVIQEGHAVSDDVGVVVRQRHHAGAQLDPLVRSAAAAMNISGAGIVSYRCWVLADPGLVVAELIQVLHQLQVRGSLASVVGGIVQRPDKGAETHRLIHRL